MRGHMVVLPHSLPIPSCFFITLKNCLFIYFYEILFYLFTLSFFCVPAISPVPSFTCLCIWTPSMCGFGHSRGMFRVCYKVINCPPCHQKLQSKFSPLVFHQMFLLYVLSFLQHCTQQWIFCTAFSWISPTASCCCNWGTRSGFQDWYSLDF